MKFFLMFGATAMTALASVGVRALESGPTVQACVQNRVIVGVIVMNRAQLMAKSIFAAAGLRLEWLPSDQCHNAPGSVFRIAMDTDVPVRFGAGTLAYAMPYAQSGTAIHVFYPRIQEVHGGETAEVLAHVIAHEMGHVLEGVARHSDQGLMKAHWTAREYSRMRTLSLPFAAEDVALIHRNLNRAPLEGLTANVGRE